MEVTLNNTRLVLLRGDITKQETGAIVNAANSALAGGGGVDGAIHRAGGPKIMEECRAIRERQGGCPTGTAVITSGGNLPARYVIHTVGPIWRGGRANEAELLRSCYHSSLRLAADHGIKTIAFPSISTGVYGYPVEAAAAVAVQAIVDYIASESGFAEIRLVLFSDRDYDTYARALAAVMKNQGD